MKLFRSFVAVLGLIFCSGAALAADASPAGTWKWTPASRGDNAALERVLILNYKDGKLTGTLKGIAAPRFTIPDVAIGEGTFQDGVVAFTVTNEFNGTKIIVKYAGTLKEDEIVGDTSRTGRDGREVKNEWRARRVKPAAEVTASDSVPGRG